jgi:hypothetical protein
MRLMVDLMRSAKPKLPVLEVEVGQRGLPLQPSSMSRGSPLELPNLIEHLLEGRLRPTPGQAQADQQVVDAPSVAVWSCSARLLRFDAGCRASFGTASGCPPASQQPASCPSRAASPLHEAVKLNYILVVVSTTRSSSLNGSASIHFDLSRGELWWTLKIIFGIKNANLFFNI